MLTLLKCSDMLIIMKLSIPPSSSKSMEGFHLQKPAGLLDAKHTNSKQDQEEQELQAGVGEARGAGDACRIREREGRAGYAAEAGENVSPHFSTDSPVAQHLLHCALWGSD